MRLKSLLQRRPRPTRRNPIPKHKVSIEPFPWRELTPAPVVGVDEVGRGCLAGPVYAAAVIWPPNESHAASSIESVVTDSKLLSANRRSDLAHVIRSIAQISVAFASVEEIERLNILGATFLAMRRAVEGLGVSEGHVLVDGSLTIPGLDEGFRQTAVVKGDLRALPISAASIVAKVERDSLLDDLAQSFPEYGFAQHKGYGTLKHREAIRQHGPTPHHRRSFQGVREFV